MHQEGPSCLNYNVFFLFFLPPNKALNSKRAKLRSVVSGSGHSSLSVCANVCCSIYRPVFEFSCQSLQVVTIVVQFLNKMFQIVLLSYVLFSFLLLQ